jgi:hypothetical protein
MIKFSREWSMPSADTFSIKPIGEFVKRYLSGISVDPFARNGKMATITNDINPNTNAEYHMDAIEFLNELKIRGTLSDVVILDMPYSPRQISECYQELGKKVAMADTQSANLYKRVRDAIMPILNPDSIVLSFGWNTVGMGINRGFEIIEIMLVCHGGAHNDTICMAEQRVAEFNKQDDLFAVNYGDWINKK